MLKTRLLLAFLIFMAIALALVIGFVIPLGPDYLQHFLPAGRAAISGNNPYHVERFVSPPWLIPLLALFALLPDKFSWGLYTVFGFLGYALAFKRMGADLRGVILGLLSGWVIFELSYGNIDWIIFLGATLPPQSGIWLVSLKPQMGAPLILLWIWQAWREKRWKGMFFLLAPIGVAFLLCYALGLFNLWGDSITLPWNRSLFPWSIPLGLFAVFWALRKESRWWALAAAPLLSPYITFHSWAALQMPFLKSHKLMVYLFVLSWVALVISTIIMHKYLNSL
jgi:hypothetical protein